MVMDEEAMKLWKPLNSENMLANAGADQRMGGHRSMMASSIPCRDFRSLGVGRLPLRHPNGVERIRRSFRGSG
jgi:hypothetical protein